jgi:predicted HTH transcriptional regulator
LVLQSHIIGYFCFLVMNLRALEELVSKGEGQRLEFKLKASFPEKIAREMVAFANSSGGELFVGVDDDGKITGLKFADEEKFVIDKAITDHIKPGIKFEFEYITVSKKRRVLHYRIFEMRRKPIYYLIDPSKKGQAFVRVEDKSVKASREMVEILRRSKKNKSYPVQLNETEQKLFRYIDTHSKATLSDFIQIAGISRVKASQILVNLVVSNILDIENDENVDYYSMKEIQYKN